MFETKTGTKKEPIEHTYTDEDIEYLLQELWLTLVSSPRSLTSEGIENHFRQVFGSICIIYSLRNLFSELIQVHL